MSDFHEFKMGLSYTQLFVQDPEMQNYWFIWTDEHVKQGFLWSKGVVSFGFPDHSGRSIIKIKKVNNYPLIDSGILWVIEVPYIVTNNHCLIGTVDDDYLIPIDKGNYQLILSVYPGIQREDEFFAYEIIVHFREISYKNFIIKKYNDYPLSSHVLQKDAQRGN